MADTGDRDEALLPPIPLHPGPWLHEELEARNLTCEWLSEQTGRPLREILDVVEERTLIGQELARALEEAMGTDAQTWINASELYLRAQERDRRRESERGTVTAAD